MNNRAFTLSIALVAAFVQLAFGNNTYFLPGDAYFYTRMDLADTKELAKTESPAINYGSPRGALFEYKCGYIGYQQLQLVGLSDESKEAFPKAFEMLRKEVESDPLLDGKMSVFVYSQRYDWKKHGVALQYNEDWVRQSVAFGASREHVRLESFGQQPTSIMQNWRDSNLVEPLNAECPKLPEGHRQAWTKSPVTADSANLQFLIIPGRNFDDFASPANETSILQISNGKLTKFSRVNGKWISE